MKKGYKLPKKYRAEYERAADLFYAGHLWEWSISSKDSWEFKVTESSAWQGPLSYTDACDYLTWLEMSVEEVAA